MLKNEKETIEQYIEEKLRTLYTDVGEGSIINIKALMGGISKIKLAILIAMKIQQKNDYDIIFGFTKTDQEFIDVVDSLKKDQILILRFYMDYTDSISHDAFLKFLLKIRAGNYIIMITDDSSNIQYKHIGGGGLTFDLIQFQKRILYSDKFDLPEYNEEKMQYYWEIEEQQRKKYFNMYLQRDELND